MKVASISRCNKLIYFETFIMSWYQIHVALLKYVYGSLIVNKKLTVEETDKRWLCKYLNLSSASIADMYHQVQL